MRDGVGFGSGGRWIFFDEVTTCRRCRLAQLAIHTGFVRQVEVAMNYRGCGWHSSQGLGDSDIDEVCSGVRVHARARVVCVCLCVCVCRYWCLGTCTVMKLLNLSFDAIWRLGEDHRAILGWPCRVSAFYECRRHHLDQVQICLCERAWLARYVSQFVHGCVHAPGGACNLVLLKSDTLCWISRSWGLLAIISSLNFSWSA